MTVAPTEGPRAGDGAPVLHLGVEASRFVREKRGIGRYVRNVLVRLPSLRPDLRMTMFVRRADHVSALRGALAELSPPLAAITDVERLSALPERRCDVVWYPWNYVTPVARRSAIAVTVHDVAPMLQLDGRWWRVVKRFKQRRRYTGSVERADIVLTVSEFTRSEMLRHLPVDGGKIRVTRLGADLPSSTGTPGDDDAPSLSRLGVRGPFFLSVGAHDARKNLVTLYQAMARLHAAGVRVPLVQCGPGASRDMLPDDAAWLLQAGYVSDAELTALYRRATALVFPSRYEGFGLPVLEALQAGGVVICADAASLPEVAGGAALLFPWHDADALASAMRRLLDDPALRAELALRGPIRAREFSWERCAADTLAGLDEAAVRGRARLAER